MPTTDLPAMLAQMPAYLSVIDARYRLRWCNRTGHGVDECDLLYQPSDICLVEEDRPKWRAWLHRVFNCREVVRYSVRFQAPTGIVRLVGKLSPVVINGEVRWAACVTHDVTHVEPTPCEGCTAACRPQPDVAPSPAPAAAPAAEARPGRWLSPLEERLLAGLASGDWTSSQKAAEAAGEPSSEQVKVILANLVERGLLESAPGRGYRLARS